MGTHKRDSPRTENSRYAAPWNSGRGSCPALSRERRAFTYPVLRDREWRSPPSHKRCEIRLHHPRVGQIPKAGLGQRAPCRFRNRGAGCLKPPLQQTASSGHIAYEHHRGISTRSRRRRIRQCHHMVFHSSPDQALVVESCFVLIAWCVCGACIYPGRLGRMASIVGPAQSTRPHRPFPFAHIRWGAGFTLRERFVFPLVSYDSTKLQK